MVFLILIERTRMVTEVKSNLKKLRELKDAMGEDMYRRAAAAVVTKYYETRTKESRAELMNKVNRELQQLQIEPMSYGFFRK
jgi:hypothetical protein